MTKIFESIKLLVALVLLLVLDITVVVENLITGNEKSVWDEIGGTK